MPVDLQPQIVNDGAAFHPLYLADDHRARTRFWFRSRQVRRTASRIEARLGRHGREDVGGKHSDYILAPYSAGCRQFPAHLTGQNRLYYAGAGGAMCCSATRRIRRMTGVQSARGIFYGLATLSRITKKAGVATKTRDDQHADHGSEDNAGNICFGFVVTGANPVGGCRERHCAHRRQRRGAHGCQWLRPPQAIPTSPKSRQNCAPAVSRDQSTIYIAVSTGSAGYLLGLDSTTLGKTKMSKARLIDPSFRARTHTYPTTPPPRQSLGPTTASITACWKLSIPAPQRSWLAAAFQFQLLDEDQDTRALSAGTIPRPSFPLPMPCQGLYVGQSSYLLMSKYNNYYGVGTGNGHNEIAILDPHASQADDL